MYGPSSGHGGSGGPRERQFTPKGQMSGGANQRPPLTDLPPHMRVMFESRMPLEYKPPIKKKEPEPYSGVSAFIAEFETGPPPPIPFFEPPSECKKRLMVERQKLNNEKNELLLSDWNPHSMTNGTENAYHTLFVGRLSYDTNEKKLRREMEQYGPVKAVKIVIDREGKPRGYAFVEFEREEDMTAAYKKADGKKLDDRRIVVDVERGRTVRNWRPRRLGGGLGGRKAVLSKKQLEEDAKKAAGGGGAPKPSPYVPQGGGGAAPPDSRGDARHGVISRRDTGSESSRYGPSSANPPSRSSAGLGYDGGADRERDRDRDRDRRDEGAGSRRDRDARDGGGGGAGYDADKRRRLDSYSGGVHRDSRGNRDSRDRDYRR